MLKCRHYALDPATPGLGFEADDVLPARAAAMIASCWLRSIISRPLLCAESCSCNSTPIINSHCIMHDKTNHVNSTKLLP